MTINHENCNILPLVVGVDEVRSFGRQLHLKTFDVNLGDTTV